MMGNVACAEGAIAAGLRDSPQAIRSHRPRKSPTGWRKGCRRWEALSSRWRTRSAAIAAVIGASWAGKKSMTVTSGPGISLMSENLGFAIGVETPCVIVNVQRGAPSTGMPTVGIQGDMVQAKQGSHGDYEIIALCPSSPQEMFDLTVVAFNYAETYRTPVFVLSDAFVGHMREEVIIPEPEKIKTVYRKIPEPGTDPQTIRGFLDEDVAPMPIFGRGFKAHVTSSCHDEVGKRNLIDISALDNYIRKLSNKILKHKEEITLVERDYEGAEIVLVSYGARGPGSSHGRIPGKGRRAPRGNAAADHGLALSRGRDREDGEEGEARHRPGEQSGSDVSLYQGRGSPFCRGLLSASETGRGDSGSGRYPSRRYGRLRNE